MTTLIVLLGILVFLLGFFVYFLLKLFTNDIEPSAGAGPGCIAAVTFLAIVLNVALIGFTSFKTFLVIAAIPVLIWCLGIAHRVSADKAEREKINQLKRASIPHEEALEHVSGPHCGNLLQFLPENLRDDRRIVAAAIAQPDLETRQDRLGKESVEPVGSPLEYASSNCRQDRELVLKAISFSAEAYNYASEDLRADPEMYIAAARAVVAQTEMFWDFYGDDIVSPFSNVFAKLGKPSVNDWFGADNNLQLFEFVVALERLFDYYETYWEGGSNPKDDQFSELVSDEYDSDGDPCWQHAGDLYEEYFPNMFQDWEVVCRVLQCMATTDDPNPSWFAVYKAKWTERYETYAPEILYQDEKGMKADAIVNRDFILYALKAGHTHVMNWAADTVKSDPEVRDLLNG